METASSLLQRQPPTLDKRRGGAIYPSIPPERLSIQFCHEWTSFKQTDLSSIVTATEENERYITGSKQGLTACINHHICDAVTKALSMTALTSNLAIFKLREQFLL